MRVSGFVTKLSFLGAFILHILLCGLKGFCNETFVPRFDWRNTVIIIIQEIIFSEISLHYISRNYFDYARNRLIVCFE